jgi:hypothetical protein
LDIAGLTKEFATFDIRNIIVAIMSLVSGLTGRKGVAIKLTSNKRCSIDPITIMRFLLSRLSRTMGENTCAPAARTGIARI